MDKLSPEITAKTDKEQSGNTLPIDLGPSTADHITPQKDYISAQDPVDADIDGITIEAYAQKKSMTTDEVWSLLKAGKIIGRTDKGKILVYSSFDKIKEIDETKMMQHLPPLPSQAETSEGPSTPQTTTNASGFSTNNPHHMERGLGIAQSPNQEIALLLDHLSLAKEENRELLKFTQDSIRKVTELTESIVEMKDSLIHAKDHEIKNLQETLTKKEQQLRSIAQANEDLETLVRTLNYKE